MTGNKLDDVDALIEFESKSNRYDDQKCKSFRTWCYKKALTPASKIKAASGVIFGIFVMILSFFVRSYSKVGFIALVSVSLVLILGSIFNFLYKYSLLLISDSVFDFFSDVVLHPKFYYFEEQEVIHIDDEDLQSYMIEEHYDEILPKYKTVCTQTYATMGGSSRSHYIVYVDKILSYRGISESLDEIVHRYFQPCGMHIFVTVQSDSAIKRFVINEKDIVEYFNLDNKFTRFRLINSLR